MTRYLCQVDDLPESAARGFDPWSQGRDSMFVVRHAGRIHAYLDECPHIEGARMAWRKDGYLSGDRLHIVCHAHGARFDVETGLCVLGPCEGQLLTSIPLKILSNGELVIAAPPHSKETNP